MPASKPPRVSVILPTYQRRDLVVRAVESVLSQAYRDFELIVVDDGSTDGTSDELARYAKQLRYRWQANRGVAAARNSGLALARGSIIAFLDSDDQWLPNHLTVVIEALDRHPSAVLVSTSPGFIIEGSEPANEARLVDYWPEMIWDASRVGFVSGIAVRSDAVARAGGFDDRMTVMEDSDLLLRLAMVGPFAVVRHRTIIRQETAGSLRDRGRRAGAYLEANELCARKLASTAAHLAEGGRASLVEQARAMEQFAAAMRALDRNDAATVRRRLEVACDVLPLSDQPVRVRMRVIRDLTRSHEPAERLRAYTMLAELWPDDKSDTARYMRALAIATALRCGRLREASQLVIRWPRGRTLQFVRRMRPRLIEVARRSVSDRRHRGRETAAL